MSETIFLVSWKSHQRFVLDGSVIEGALRILEQAESWFRNAVDAEAGLVDVELVRLVTRYDMGHYDEVLGDLPNLQSRARALGMETLFAKTKMLEGVVLKSLGHVAASYAPLRQAVESEVVRGNPTLLVFAIESLADSYSVGGRSDQASDLLRAVAEALPETGAPTARAFLTMQLGQARLLAGDFEGSVRISIVLRERFGNC